jgi:hypothetical protein
VLSIIMKFVLGVGLSGNCVFANLNLYVKLDRQWTNVDKRYYIDSNHLILGFVSLPSQRNVVNTNTIQTDILSITIKHIIKKKRKTCKKYNTVAIKNAVV